MPNSASAASAKSALLSSKSKMGASGILNSKSAERKCREAQKAQVYSARRKRAEVRERIVLGLYTVQYNRASKKSQTKQIPKGEQGHDSW